MIEQDEMMRMLVTRYAPKLAKVKKQASYMLQEKVAEADIPLEEAIKKKCDPNQMDDAYHPNKVEKYWNAWWE